MNQLGLDLPDAAREKSSRPVERRRPPVTDSLKRDILSALQLEQLPPHLVAKDGGIWLSLWPNAYDLRFLQIVLNDWGHRDALDFHTVKAGVYQLVSEGRVIEGCHYYGSERPGAGDYRGFKPVFRLPEVERHDG